MSIGSKIYESYMSHGQTAMRSRKKGRSRRARRESAICPFTLEAIKDCAMRHKARHSTCLFSLEGCLSHR